MYTVPLWLVLDLHMCPMSLLPPPGMLQASKFTYFLLFAYAVKLLLLLW